MATDNAPFTFSDLIAPLGADQFFAEYWEAKPLHLSREHRHYARLISVGDVETMLAKHDIRHPGIRLAKAGRYLAPDTYSTDMHYGDDLFRGVPDLDTVYAHYRTGASVILPALHRTWTPLPRPMLEIDLMPGDVLYLPRGYVHDTLTSDVHSVHVTLGISVYTWVELIAEALAACKERVDLRRALPPGFANSPESAASLASSLHEILGTLQSIVEPRTVVNTFTSKVVPGTIKQRGLFKPQAATIGADTRLYRLPPGRFHVSDDENEILLTFDGKSMRLPSYVRDAIETITGGESFLVRDLASGLGMDASVTLGHALFLAGFVTAELEAACT